MKFGSRRVIVGVVGTAAVWALSMAMVAGQAGQAARQRPPATAQNQMLAETAFINITALRGIPADEFMGTMGIFSAATGLNCFDCHVDTGTPEGFAQDTPRKQTARRMVAMMAEINKTNFAGRQVVTCYTCHRGSNAPRATPSMVGLYAPVVPDELDVLIPPAPQGTPTAAQILDKYLQAIGGAQRAAALTSYVAKGTYTGYGPENFPRTFELYAKAPNQKTLAVRDPESGDIITVFNGTAGWISQPFKNIDVLDLHTAELDSARADAELTFPANLKAALTGMRSSRDFLNDRSVFAVQGAKGMALVTMYFDEETGLMTRLVRSTPSPVGRIVVQTDYAGYRDVMGLKIPSKWTTAWFDGRSNFEITEVQPNVAIDAARFAKPSPPKPY
jgi:outer membrane lipoprotein-sorting protein